jgi:hypothetical protein
MRNLPEIPDLTTRKARFLLNNRWTLIVGTRLPFCLVGTSLVSMSEEQNGIDDQSGKARQRRGTCGLAHPGMCLRLLLPLQSY